MKCFVYSHGLEVAGDGLGLACSVRGDLLRASRRDGLPVGQRFMHRMG